MNQTQVNFLRYKHNWTSLNQSIKPDLSWVHEQFLQQSTIDFFKNSEPKTQRSLSRSNDSARKKKAQKDFERVVLNSSKTKKRTLPSSTKRISELSSWKHIVCKVPPFNADEIETEENTPAKEDEIEEDILNQTSSFP